MSVFQDHQDIKLIFQGFDVPVKKLSAITHAQTEFEKKVVGFAAEWLSGKNVFEFQTSGSTGIPRRIKFSREQIKASVKLTQEFFSLRPGQKALLCLDPDFIAGKMMIVRALEIGMDIYCTPPVSNPLEFLKTKVDFAAFVPYQLEAILNSESASAKLKMIKTAIVGGSQVSDPLTQKLQTSSTRFFETYGMTETLTHIAIRKLNPAEETFTTLPGIKISLDERPCLNIQAGHLGNEVIQTHDLVNIFSERSFQVIGRYDNVINTGGIKVSPEDLENKVARALRNHFPNCNYFIAGVKDQSFGEKVVLYIEGAQVMQPKKNELLADLKSVLRKWEVPKEIIIVPAFTRTNSGKINRKETQLNLISS